MWVTVDVERALYVDRGRNVILCELMPGHQTLVLKLKGREMIDGVQRLRSALESIADWRKVDISGEHELGLRDIIRSIIDCAVDALDAPQHERKVMTTESAPKNSLVSAFDAYIETEEAADMLRYIQASKPSAILFMAFSAGWAARRDYQTSSQLSRPHSVPAKDCGR
ncbi:hypothetical protein [Bradyrhizobium sp. 188]|uniref:hypothetical protein n=1 Tax=Bradyrhizobium sp. 188 TaxID=2782656 RepID=UPI001FFA75B5|nr:hypothetical protein [Bradyrhizobium sp. 188]MCK1501528.1 hypothetical protein [Bradyrhizobium sp. 188]